MAEAMLSFGVQKLWGLLVREPEQFHGVDEQFTELKSYLNLLRSFLKDADAKKHTNATVRNYMEEIKEIVCDTEDIIETFLLKEELQKTSGIRKRAKRLAFIIVDRRELASDMRAVSKRISKVIYDMQSFGIQQRIVDSVDSQPQEERKREMRQTFSSENEIDLVGLENNVKTLLRYLVEEDNIQVVSITGMGGIGKTTLARQVFNHEMVKHHFDGLVWVCVSQQFTRKYVWQMILRKLSPKHDEYRVLAMMEDELQDKLFRLLEAHNPLIVLDDMWKEEDWDRIKLVFPPKKGWKVLLTSRNEGVALHAHKNCVTLKPECLTPEDSWTLFQRIAFPMKDTADYKFDEEMEELGRHMIKHCGGLPLAVKVLGGLLASQYTLREWKRVYENIGSQLVGGTSFNNGDSSLVNYVLSLSYEELPVYLKHCFLYLAHFPEDYAIDVEKLSNYWVAEGIPKPRNYHGSTIRDVAEAYIEELVKRNMVISERDATTSRFETCHLHDMMRELCLLKAEEENFIHIVDARICFPTAHSQSTCTSRRLVINCPITFYAEREVRNPKLRSLLFFWFLKNDWTASGLCFTELKLLRVLDLYRAEFQGGKLPSNVGKLIHLRYLSLEETNVSHLPSSLRNLKVLLYLNLLVHKESVYVPNVLKEMQELRYLALPVLMHEKTKLKLADLVNLETLKNFSTTHGNVRDLQGMIRLETLSILFNGGCNVETLSSSLGELRRLGNLTIDDDKVTIYPTDGGDFVLNCLHLNQLNLSISMPRIPDGKHFPSHLTDISLSLCCLEEDPMPILEKLLLLKRVNFGNRAFAGKRIVCSCGGFPQLQELVLSGQEEWEEWIVEEGSMPLLHTMSVGGCKKLKGLPDGLEYLTSLKELKIGVMTVEFQERLEEGGEDYYKFQHIPLVQFFYFG